MRINISHDLERLRQELNVQRAALLPITAKAINECLIKAEAAVRLNMQQVFDRPTNWTLNSYRVLKYAKPEGGKLYGIVGFKDTGYKGGPSKQGGSTAGQYLQPHMDAGPRGTKGLERLMRSRGLLGASEFIVPSRYQPLDNFGNVPNAVIKKIVANLQVGRDAYSNTPRGGARGGKKKAEYFFTRRGVRGATLTAIWHRSGRPAFIVVEGAPKYRKRFDQERVVMLEVERNFRDEFEAAFARAVGVR